MVESGRRNPSCRPRRPPPPHFSLSLSFFRDLTLRFPTASGAPPAAASSSSCRVRLRSGAASFSCLMFSMLSVFPSLTLVPRSPPCKARAPAPPPLYPLPPLSTPPRAPQSPPSSHQEGFRRRPSVALLSSSVYSWTLEQRSSRGILIFRTFPRPRSPASQDRSCARRAVVGSRRDEGAGLSPGRARPLRTSVTTTT